MRFVLRTLILIFLFAAGGARGAEHDLSAYEGLSGRSLASAIRKDFAPSHLPDGLPIADYFPESWPADWMPALWPGDGSIVTLLVTQKWSGTPIYDLYNIISGDEDFIYERSDYPPASLSTISFEAEGWAVGEYLDGGFPSNGWQPSADRRGDVARRMMYVALMYPQELWRGRGCIVMADGEWPLLTTYGRTLLKQWADEDPVDNREMIECAEIAAIQGNENPFIVFPDLYDYLWGENAGQGYIPDEKRDRTPLKGTYSRSLDGYIDLYSPYVPEGAVWEFDGRPTDGQTISLDRIVPGIHTISYKWSAGRGKLKIEVVE